MRRVALPEGCDLYIGVIDHDDRDGDSRRIAAAAQTVSDFGIAAECGRCRSDPARAPGLLDSHRIAPEEGWPGGPGRYILLRRTACPERSNRSMEAMMIPRLIAVAAAVAALAAATAAPTSWAGPKVLDLTHPIPTYKPMAKDPTKADMNRPWGDARRFPSFGAPAILSMVKFPTSQGHFDLGTLTVGEHHGTHIDSPGHYVNNKGSMEAAGTPPGKRRLVHQLTAEDLIGRIVLIDISGRVQAELDKNGGKPSPDKSVTDFSNSSPNVVGADDIAAVADKLQNGDWLVLNLGWSRFYFQGADFMKDPYINGFNHPGLSKAGVDKLIEVLEARKVRINGIVADNIGIDSGQSGVGDDDKWTNSWHAHVRLLQRGILFVENAANLGLLAQVDDPGKCLLTVGAPKHIRGTGGPSRVMAICN